MSKPIARNHDCRIWEVIIDSSNVLFLENDLIRVGILLDKGTDIFEFLYKPTDTDFLWRSMLGFRSESGNQLTSASKGGNFLDYYFGGWQELFPSTDEACVYKGAEIGIHGEVDMLPWKHIVLEDTPERISVRFSVSTIRTPFKLEKTMILEKGKPVLFFKETIQNIGNEDMDCTWGMHPALGEPFLSSDCQVYVPRCKMKTDGIMNTPFSRIAVGQDTEWPLIKGNNGEEFNISEIPPGDIKANDRVLLYDFAKGWYAVKNQKTDMFFGMVWDKAVFPYILFWQSYNGWDGYPFYGTAYTLALEPRSSYPFPLTRAIEANTQIVLAPNESISTDYLTTVGSCVGNIIGISEDGVIQFDKV